MDPADIVAVLSLENDAARNILVCFGGGDEVREDHAEAHSRAAASNAAAVRLCCPDKRAHDFVFDLRRDSVHINALP